MTSPQTQAIDPASEAAVTHNLTRSFVDNARTGLNAAILAAPVVLAMLWGHVNTLGLSIWVVVVAVLSAYRHWVVRHYRRYYAHSLAQEGERFIQRHTWSWPASSMAWSAALFLYLDRAPLGNQFASLMVLVGMGGMAVSLMSARMANFRSYVDALVLTAAAAILWRLNDALPSRAYLLGLLALLAVFWWLLRSSGARFHRVQRRSFELRSANTQLIESLLTQTNAAREAVQVKNRFLAQAAHDLRQPVHALAFYADWLRSEPELSKDIVPKILQCTDSVHALFDSLFDFAKIDAGVLATQLEAVSIEEAVNDTKLQFEHTAQAKGLALRQRIHPALVLTDPILLRRILGNLVANALRYTQQGGVLLISRQRGDQLWLEVWDTGIGIAQEDQAKVFQEFYKVRQHDGTEEGFGLGLAIVRRLSQLLGIGLSLCSKPGKGTRIRLALPLAKAREGQGADNQSQA